jgi:hypothetical protein
VKEGKIACTSFPLHGGMILFEMCLCLCKKKVSTTCTSFPPWWNDVRDAFVLVQNGKAMR